jgi:hypothetical protein
LFNRILSPESGYVKQFFYPVFPFDSGRVPTGKQRPGEKTNGKTIRVKTRKKGENESITG